MVLDERIIRDTIRRYVEEASEQHSDGHLLNPPKNDDEHEAHVGILVDELPRLQAVLESSRFDDSTVAKVCELFGLDPFKVDRRDLQFLKACRAWTRATLELYEDHFRRLGGEPTAGEQSYLRPERVATPEYQQEADQPSAGPRVSEVLEPFLSDRQKRRKIAGDTVENYRRFAQAFIDLEGDLEVGAVTPSIAEGWRDKLLEYPKNRKKSEDYRDKSPLELVAMEIPEADRLGVKTVNNHLIYLSTIYDYLVKRQITPYNPFKGMEIKAEAAPRAAFTLQDLNVIFSSPMYDTESAYFKHGQRTAAQWWLLLLGIYSGARVAELNQMRLEDVVTEDGVLLLKVVRNEAKGQRVKTDSSIRDIPVHPRLLALGFADYVEELRVAGKDRVLEGFPLGSGKKGVAASKWYDGYRKGGGGAGYLPGFAESGKVLHSARHTFYTAALNEAQIGTQYLKRLVGHSLEEDLGAGVHYNEGAGPQRLFEEISKLNYTCSALDNLGQDWRKLKRFK